MGPRKASRKSLIFEWIFDAKMGGLEWWKPSSRSILVAKYEVSAFREKTSKMRANMPPKSHQNRPGDVQWGHFLNFLRSLEVSLKSSGRLVGFLSTNFRPRLTSCCRDDQKTEKVNGPKSIDDFNVSVQITLFALFLFIVYCFEKIESLLSLR